LLRTVGGRLATGMVATMALSIGAGAAVGLDAASAHRAPATPRLARAVIAAISVTTPTVPVKLPTVPITPPPVPVKPPPVPVKAPTIPVKPPPAPVKPPTIPVKPPPVPVKTPTVPVKPPTVPVKLPTVPVKPPPVPVKAPPVLPKPSTGPVKAPTAPVNLPAPRQRTSPPALVKSIAGRLPSPVGRLTGAGAPAAGSARSAGSGAGPTRAGLSGAAGTLLSGAAAQGSSAARSGYSAPPELPDVTQMLAEGHGRLNNARVRALVLGLRGCLAGLPHRLRSLLELRTGAGGSRPLSPRRVAIRLRIGRGRVTSLELTALRRLRRLAETTGCAAVAQPQPSFLLASFLVGSEGGGPALGGVESARYQQLPGQAGAQSLPSPGAPSGPLGVSALGSGDSMFLVLAGVVLVLLMLLGVLDGLGIGPRHRYRGGTGGRQ
jgi:hypothetical protein